MNNISKTIFESYQLGKSKKDKKKFIDYYQNECNKNNIPFDIEPSILLGTKNIVIGNVESAKLVISAHYDTAPRMIVPNIVAPKSWVTNVLYNVFLLAVIFLLDLVFRYVVMAIFNIIDAPILKELLLSLSFFLVIIIFFFSFTNKHTANDNTSGVITLTELIFSNQVDFNKVCFVLFDKEESGLFGSWHFNKKHKVKMKNTPLLNVDCVSDGDALIVMASKNLKNDEFMSLLAESYVSCNNKKIEVTNSFYYPSDQVNFKKGIVIGAFKQSKLFGYYSNRIHTARDIIFDEKNIAILKDSTLKLIEKL